LLLEEQSSSEQERVNRHVALVERGTFDPGIFHFDETLCTLGKVSPQVSSQTFCSGGINIEVLNFTNSGDARAYEPLYKRRWLQATR